MKPRVFLYTPWQEQGLSYDAKVIEQLYIQHDYEVVITYRTRKKVKWPCTFIPIREASRTIGPQDVFFTFEIIPYRFMEHIFTRTDQLYHMVNYEYYEPDMFPWLARYKSVLCKSLIALHDLERAGLTNLVYRPWILYEFPLSGFRNISDDGPLRVVFNGGTGGYRERRNLEAVVNLIRDYSAKNVHFTLKINQRIQRWSKSILNANARQLDADSRVSIIRETLSPKDYRLWLQNFDVNLAPSKFEGFGLTLLEALSANLPTLTLDVSPMNEIVVHEKSGICVPAHQIGHLNQQPIFEASRQDVLEGFNKLISDPVRLRSYKQNIPAMISGARKDFQEQMEMLLFE